MGTRTPRLVFFAATAAAWAQQRYEVATIKPSPGANPSMLQRQPGGRFIATGVTLNVLIQEAYDVRGFQILGGPKWVNSDLWDIAVKAEGNERMLTKQEGRPLL